MPKKADIKNQGQKLFVEWCKGQTKVVKKINQKNINDISKDIGIPSRALLSYRGGTKPSTATRGLIERFTGIPADSWDKPIDPD
jgi:hypothetical protein